MSVEINTSGPTTEEEPQKRTWSQKRAEQRMEKQQRYKEAARGEGEKRRLSFITEAMKANDVSKEELARRMQVTPPYLTHIINLQDDCKISMTEKIAAALGYDLSYEIDCHTRPSEVILSKMPEPVHQAAADKSKRLHPLAAFILPREQSIYSLGERTGIPRTSIGLYFTNDNISVSKLMRIVSAYPGATLVWKMTGKKAGTDDITTRVTASSATIKKEAKEPTKETDPSRRLAFIQDLMQDNKTNQRELARKAKLDPQSVYYYLTLTDDCKLSMAERLVNALGYTLRLELEPRGNTTSFARYKVKKAPAEQAAADAPEYLLESLNGGRLSALSAQIIREGGNVSRFAAKCGVVRETLRQSVLRDDIMISELYKIAENMGYELTWQIAVIP